MGTKSRKGRALALYTNMGRTSLAIDTIALLEQQRRDDVEGGYKCLMDVNADVIEADSGPALDLYLDLESVSPEPVDRYVPIPEIDDYMANLVLRYVPSELIDDIADEFGKVLARRVLGL
tara:strand:- start:143 stop:502 length:360 start_codon:yes stop_codon:yes gene_type:complete